MSKQEIEENPPCPLCEEPMSSFVSGEGPCDRCNCPKHGEFNEYTLLLPKKLIKFLRNMEEVS